MDNYEKWLFPSELNFVYLAVALILLLYLLRFLRGNTQNEAYRAKKELLNKPERELFARLKTALEDKPYVILAQVSLSQVFDFDKKEANFMQKLNAVARKSVDFLVCTEKDWKIIAAIELNGPLHHRKKQKEADRVKRFALESAGIALLVYTPEALPSISEIRSHFLSCFVP